MALLYRGAGFGLRADEGDQAAVALVKGRNRVDREELAALQRGWMGRTIATSTPLRGEADPLLTQGVAKDGAMMVWLDTAPDKRPT